MDIRLVSEQQIREEIENTRTKSQQSEEQVRVLFVPPVLTNENLKSVYRTYSRLARDSFRTAVFVESTPGEAKKKLTMPSFKSLTTHIGEVVANERLRNDFADEDDDFFINDNAFDNNSGLFHQLPILQSVLDDFSVLSIQITDERVAIIKELAMAIQEILPSRNALLVCCCKLPKHNKLQKIQNFIKDDNLSGLLNWIYQMKSEMEGFGTLLSGLLVAKRWGLKIYFDTDSTSGDLSTGYAVVENQPIFG